MRALTLAAALVALCATLTRPAHASHQSYALALATIAINESPRVTFRDVALHHQAASFHGSDSRGRLRWLRRHSARVLGSRECRAGRNCRWSRQLWADPLSVPEGADLAVWNPARWARVQEWAAALEDGSARLEPCPVPIATWGSADDFATGPFASVWVALDCGAHNLGGVPVRLAERLGIRRPEGADPARGRRQRPSS